MKMYNFGELSKIVQEKFEDEFPVRMHAKIKDRSDWHDFLVRAEKEMKGVGIKTYHSDLTGKYIRISFVGASEKKVLDWLGKYEKILGSARNVFFVLANAGCLFLASGLILENFFLIKGGIFILIVQILIDVHFIISKYQRNKSIEKEEEKSNAKK